MRSPKYASLKVARLLEQFSHTGDGAFAVGADHRIILWNRAAEELLGYSAKEALGRFCHEVIQGRDGGGKRICNKRCRHFAEARRHLWTPSVTLQSRTKSGQDTQINVSTLAIFSSQDKLSSLVHIFRQTGELKTSPDACDPHQVPRRSPGLFPAVRNDAAEKAKPVPLSSRELTVLRHLAEGLDTKTIAARLLISPNTVRNHVQSILTKLQVHSRLEAVLHPPIAA